MKINNDKPTGTLPQHPQARAAKRIDVNNRLAEVTRAVYREAGQETANDHALIDSAFAPESPSEDGLQVFFGDLHCHTNFSDGCIEPAALLEAMSSRVDFCALTDHDHGGLWHDTLYGSKWAILQKLAAEAYRPGSFTPLVGYERDSYPWYDNMIVYFGDHTHPMLSCDTRGETNDTELASWLARSDVFIAPHDTDSLTCSTDFSRRPKNLLPHGFEMISRGDCAEYFDHPLNVCSCVRGGSYQDALAAGAYLAAIGGADSHDGTGALDLPELGPIKRFPGMTGLWARDNTLEGIFEALRGRRTYAFMGPERITIDFRVNSQRMGACLDEETAPCRRIYYSIQSEVPPVKVTVVKNNMDFFVSRGERIHCSSFVDYERLTAQDWYYLRVTLADGRQAWTSPCWVRWAQNEP